MRAYKRLICGCTAAVMAVSASACAKKAGGDKKTDSGETTTRETVPLEPVEETLGDFDLSEVPGGDASVPADFKYEVEAEKGKFDGGSSMDKKFVGEFSGKGFAALPNEASVTFDIEFPAEGSYDFLIRAAADSENSSASITIDGNALTTFEIAEKEFCDAKAEKVLVGEGKHTIGIKAQSVPVYIDSIVVQPAESIDLSQFDVNRSLCNPNSSVETWRLYNFLCDSYGKYIISGQYASDNLGLESREFIEIEKMAGDYPAMMGLDLIELSPSRVSHGSGGGINAINNAKDFWLNQGGIVTLTWHWNAPEPYIEKNGGAWWQGFYTEYTDIDLAKIMSGEDKEGYDLLISDIDAIAEYLKDLDDNHVPVLWRPLHEGGGDPKWNNPWFWWGSSGADAYKQLWITLYDRLTNYHNINNLIWVWDGQNKDYYPGDEYVDILGYDVYADAGDYSSKKWYYDFTKSCTEDKKIVAMTENGTLFDPEAAMNDGTRWGWFATWNGEFTLKDMQLPGEYTSMEMWEKIYSSDRVLTLKELPDLKRYPLNTEKYLALSGDEQE